MLDTKIKIAFEEPDVIQLDYKGVQVKSYLSRDDQEVLRAIYMSEYFEDNSPSHVLNAEYTLMVALVELCTNIMVSEDVDGEPVPALQLNALLSNFRLVKSIRDAISNYSEFRALLRASVEEEKERRRLEGSLGKAISGLSETFGDIFEMITNLDTSDESLNRMRDVVSGLEKSPIITEVLNLLQNGEKKEA